MIKGKNQLCSYHDENVSLRYEVPPYATGVVVFSWSQVALKRAGDKFPSKFSGKKKGCK